MLPNPPRPRRGQVIALIGAESTGKTQLARELRDALACQGRSVGLVEEFLREFCDQAGRTPRRDEQLAIAAEQTSRIDQAAGEHELVIADTTALMIAVYSDLLFQDPTLFPMALQEQERCALSLLTALDLPWRADAGQRDGEHVREPVDASVRGAMAQAGLPFSVVYGSGPSRLTHALISVRKALALDPEPLADTAAGRHQWHSFCERCGDPDCERHSLAR